MRSELAHTTQAFGSHRKSAPIRIPFLCWLGFLPLFCEGVSLACVIAAEVRRIREGKRKRKRKERGRAEAENTRREE
jgi:hypothetical protein